MAYDKRFRHEAFLYAGDDDFLARTTAFIRDAADAGEPTLVAVDATKIRALRTELGKDVDTVEFADTAALGRNPARIIPAWQSFVDRHGSENLCVRGVSEQPLAGRSAEEILECHHHETLLNHAFAGNPGFWLLCPYDTATLDAALVDHAHGTHPHIDHGGRSEPSGRFHLDESPAFLREPLPDPPGKAETQEFGAADLASVRQTAARYAASQGVPGLSGDLALVASELGTNSVRHGGGRGVLRLWQQGTSLICEVEDRGHLADPFVGRRRPVDGQVGGRGLWVLNQICDLVQVRSSGSGTVVRTHLSL